MNVTHRGGDGGGIVPFAEREHAAHPLILLEGSPAPKVLKAVVRTHQNTAGIYGTVTRIGRLAVGQTMFLHAAAGRREPD